ncbi:MAG: hypothetical protein M1840_001494 [Geoglossum simile]|nr:MAG: hypothetical protein M1840_001494 [Geoglossum simile]
MPSVFFRPRRLRNSPSPPPNPTRKDEILQACNTGDLTKLEILLDQPLPTPEVMLSHAARSGHIDAVRYLLARYPDIPITIPLHIAAFQGGIEVYKVFLDHYPNLLEEEFGQMGNAIGLAAGCKDLKFLKFLLGRGVDANKGWFFHRSVLSWAKESSTPEVVELLVQHGATMKGTGEFDDRGFRVYMTDNDVKLGQT